MKKRILSILLVCCMVLTLLPTAAFAAGELPDVKLSVPTTFDKIVDLTGQNKELKIKDSKTYLIKGSTDPNWYFQYRIKIDGKNNTPHIFLDGVRLQAPEDGPAIELYGGASACLYFIGNDSELIGAENFAALQKNKTEGYLRVLVQTGTKLTCEGGRYGAGIGGSKVGIKKFSQGHGMNLHFGSLATDIYGGEILATSGVYGAGIGGGQGGVGEQIYVYSGKLTVRSVSEGAGIGGGQGGPGRFIYIKGGTVNAGSESGGAGIGSGDQDGQNKSEDAHHIEISGGTVEAWSNYAGAGIGGGRGGSGYDISITGGVVRAQGYLGAGIGGGMNGNSGNILIKDTTLTALAFPLYQDYGYTELSASAVGRGSNRAYYMAVMQDQEFAMIIEENIKIGASDGKSVWLSATGWQWRHNQEPYKKYWGTTTELLIPNENGRVDLQRLSLPYAYNYGRVISKLELRCEESTCSHELGWTDRDGCHIWACVKCGARDPAAEMSKQNAKHIPGDWGNQKQLCTVCGHVMGTDTKAPVLEGLNDGESYTVEDTIDGNPGAYTFTVSDPAASGETSSGIKSVTINGEPQDGPTYRLPAPDGGNNDAGAEYTVVATDNAGNETTATVRTYRWHHVKVISPDGNGTASASPDKAVAGTEITLTATPKEDYRFKEWQVVSPAGLVITNNKFTMPDSNVEVKAIFEEDAPTAPTEHTVRFNANGGGGTMADVTGVSGSYTLPACGFTEPEGKQFKGWSTSADGSVISGTTYEVSSDTTFYAIWESKEYSIIVTDGKATIGAGSEISKAAQGTTITLTANAAPDGKVFDKWIVESGNTTLEDANSETTTFIMPDSEVSVKATYTIPHTHTYDQEIQKPETLKSAADCTNDAVYFKSCSCGEISTTETFTAAGTQLGHAWASDWSKDTDNHWKECSRCHEKKDEAAHDYGSDNICDTCGYDKTVPHTHNLTLVPAKAPTCTEKGNTAYYTCDGCDKWFEDATGASEITDKTSVILAATGHSASDWKSDNTDHWKECTVVGCGVIIEGSKAAHTAGEWIIDTPATATTSGSKHKECTVCGYTMATETISATGGGEHTHSYGSEWKNDADNHWHECSCGDKKDTAAHTAGEWIIDTPATATTSGTKHKKCTVCGYTMATETIPATGGGEHTHSYGSDWKNDATNHWHECSCGDKADKAAHDFKWVVDKEATATQKGSKHEECRVCGYKKAAVEIPATGTPTEPGKPTDSDSPQTGDNSNMILWIALLFVSGGVVIGIIVYSKKKKENAE
ncbi:LPXTG cell wall anchor domain-containing protein [Coprococcus sp. AF16-5]|uniref:InlB B-repeat-containing protein n=1 Tax=Coprococcus sp. AF16-5 TaxID=2293088 RepID=UPI000E544015|nr:InlB B-repeat-containing protein [Coprococcus sp. AF16-5]RHR65132.1 LPXTG cell wall anchor domain-containing protein [Coprococcus sp. AF16-5]